MFKAATVCILLILVSPQVYSQDDLPPWERLGLSLTEWKLIQDNNMPMSKVEHLLRCGIGIGEYFAKPWEKLGISESKWIALRRSGLSSYDIELEVRESSGDTRTQPTPEGQNSFQDFDPSSENRKIFTSFFLPGYLQCKREQKVRGRIMISCGIASIVGSAAWSIAERQFISMPLFTVLLPDMAWSLIDHKIYVKRNRR